MVSCAYHNSIIMVYFPVLVIRFNNVGLNYSFCLVNANYFLDRIGLISVATSLFAVISEISVPNKVIIVLIHLLLLIISSMENKLISNSNLFNKVIFSISIPNMVIIILFHFSLLIILAMEKN